MHYYTSFLYTYSCVLSYPSRHFSDLCFFFNHTATTEIYTLSLHDALPILAYSFELKDLIKRIAGNVDSILRGANPADIPLDRKSTRLNSYLVCRLLLEKKKKYKIGKAQV